MPIDTYLVQFSNTLNSMLTFHSKIVQQNCDIFLTIKKAFYTYIDTSLKFKTRMILGKSDASYTL
jgi:hypothetical protein